MNTMLPITEDTLLVGSTELRTEMPKLAKALKDRKKAIITQRGNPLGVLQDYETYQEKEAMLEAFEDLVLGYIAKERDENSTEKDYIDEEVFLKEIGLK